jgi:transposase InsO family protein
VLSPSYHPPRPAGHAKPCDYVEAVCHLRREHTTWGAGLILVILHEQHPDWDLPSHRTAQRWLHAAGLAPAPRGRHPKVNPRRATRPHEVWQMDAAECLLLANGQYVCWLRVVDEFTGAVLQTTVFPTRPYIQVGAVATQAELRRAFARWGLPERIRVDNGAPWGSDDGLPTEFACWLVGLGVPVVTNPPYRAQANGVVERFQGVGQQWAEPQTCRTADELQCRLDEMDRREREAYPRADGKSRLAAFPTLAHSGRLYALSDEEVLWELERVTEELSRYVIRRKVDPQGKIRVYNTPRSVGRDRIGQWVWVSLDAEERRWVIADERGLEIRRVEAPEVSREAVMGVKMCYRTPGRPPSSGDPTYKERRNE